MSILRILRLQWDRIGAWACVAAGAVALILGWVGVSGTGYAAEQLPYIISGGVGGAFLLGLGAMLWVSADLRDEWLKLDRLEERVGEVRETIRERGVVYVTELDAGNRMPPGAIPMAYVPGIGPMGIPPQAVRTPAVAEEGAGGPADVQTNGLHSPAPKTPGNPSIPAKARATTSQRGGSRAADRSKPRARSTGSQPTTGNDEPAES